MEQPEESPDVEIDFVLNHSINDIIRRLED
jgi:hypothetical protein